MNKQSFYILIILLNYVTINYYCSESQIHIQPQRQQQPDPNAVFNPSTVFSLVGTEPQPSKQQCCALINYELQLKNTLKNYKKKAVFATCPITVPVVAVCNGYHIWVWKTNPKIARSKKCHEFQCCCLPFTFPDFLAASAITAINLTKDLYIYGCGKGKFNLEEVTIDSLPSHKYCLPEIICIPDCCEKNCSRCCLMCDDD